ncbi:12360_t:CDS:2, partial [Dentiscutata heterogama]
PVYHSDHILKPSKLSNSDVYKDMDSTIEQQLSQAINENYSNKNSNGCQHEKESLEKLELKSKSNSEYETNQDFKENIIGSDFKNSDTDGEIHGSTGNRILKSHIDSEIICEDWLQSTVKKYNLKEIPYKELSHKKRINEGRREIIFSVKCVSLGDVVIKEIDNKDRDTLERYSKAKHHRIIQFHGVTINKDEATRYLIMEYANNGNLRKYLRDSNPGWPEKIRLTIQIAEGMSYLHRINIIHCDL